MEFFKDVSNKHTQGCQVHSFIHFFLYTSLFVAMGYFLFQGLKVYIFYTSSVILKGKIKLKTAKNNMKTLCVYDY